MTLQSRILFWLLLNFLSVSKIFMVKRDEVLHLSVVACGDRLEETLVLLKSASIFSQNPLYFHIFADDDLRPLFEKQLLTWPDFVRENVKFAVYPITYPADGGIDWKKVFKPCATQRLFIPYVLEKFAENVERLIYVDTDILFFRPLEDVWAHFENFNSSHIAGLTPEHETPWAGWYNRFARHPYYGELGVNSGVMLMDLKLIRANNWQQFMIDSYKKYRYNITWGDQDLINIFFSANPEKLYVFPCHWNYRADHCMYGSVCKIAEEEGVHVVHGNRGYYHNDKQPAFKAIYQAMRDYKFGQDLDEFLLVPMKEALADTAHTYCGKVAHIFTKELERQVKIMKTRDLKKAKNAEVENKENIPNENLNEEDLNHFVDEEKNSVKIEL